ncbi:uncharacterized protein LOC111461952 [Cucurbita moschata]|uniref:Uncharacterized protein LOC111461952 n=1 Tax=Cucurbita moschata TaxID=3662 RepID=A0A6J1HA02_CUCMO|nr:uncharacterized protein LOC111461952 [Cucurbita moschata]
MTSLEAFVLLHCRFEHMCSLFYKTFFVLSHVVVHTVLSNQDRDILVFGSLDKFESSFPFLTKGLTISESRGLDDPTCGRIDMKDKEELISRIYGGGNYWPYRMKLSTDRLRWDSLKISEGTEFEEMMLRNMNEGSYRDLNEMIPIEISIFDVDICETYKVKLVKKEAFWFEPLPLVGEKSSKKYQSSFVYSIEPFRHIVKKRGLDYGQEIGLRWSGSKTIDRFDFSILSSSRLSVYNLI